MLKYVALALGLLMGTQATALDLDAMTDNERAAFRAEIRSYLLENPEVLMEAIGVLEQREQAAKVNNDVTLAQTYAGQLFDDGHSFVGGNPDGDITIVEFMDYRCGFCKKAFPEVAALIAGDGNIRYIVKEFPILGEASTLASQFAIAVKIVAGDEAYKDVHDTLMEFRGDVTQNSLDRLAESLDLDVAAITVEMRGGEVAKVINDNRLLAQAMQITGTPTFIVQDQMLRGYVPFAQMEQIVAKVRDDR
ncbi:MAG: thioredoxin domain-containing protein [Yoonia sp.]|nr:thioredoxin domain-containing protein [Yoonia sp.]